MSKNVLIITPYFRPGYKAGGPIKSIDNLSTYLSGKGFIINILCLNEDIDGDEYREITTGVATVFRKNINVTYVKRSDVSFSLIGRVLRNTSYDYIYVNGFFDRLFSLKIQFMRYFAHRSEGKILIAPRGEFYPGALEIKKYKKRFVLFFMKKISKGLIFHATSKAEKGYLEGHFPKREVRFAPNIQSINTKHSLQRSYNPEDIRFVFLSRISEKKNLMCAVKIVLNANRECSLDVFGPAEDQVYFKKCIDFVATHNNAHRISYKGEITPQDVSRTLSGYDFFILPTAGENYGHVIAEALAASVPIIVGPATPWTGYISEFECGCIFDPTDPNAGVDVEKFVYELDEEDMREMRDRAYSAFVSSVQADEHILYLSEIFR